MSDKPVTGGVVSALQLIAVLSVIFAFFGGAIANLSLPAEFVLMVSAFVTATFIWATAVVIQELRNISFNTKRIGAAASESAPNAATRGAEPSSAHNVGGLR